MPTPNPACDLRILNEQTDFLLDETLHDLISEGCDDRISLEDLADPLDYEDDDDIMEIAQKRKMTISQLFKKGKYYVSSLLGDFFFLEDLGPMTNPPITEIDPYEEKKKRLCAHC